MTVTGERTSHQTGVLNITPLKRSASFTISVDKVGLVMNIDIYTVVMIRAFNEPSLNSAQRRPLLGSAKIITNGRFSQQRSKKL